MSNRRGTRDTPDARNALAAVATVLKAAAIGEIAERAAEIIKRNPDQFAPFWFWHGALEPRPGSHIDDCIKAARMMAAELGRPVSFTHNGRRYHSEDE